MVSKKIGIIAAALVFTLLCSVSALCFQDVLEVPAIMSSLAPKSLLNGAAMAGKRVVLVGFKGHIIYSDDAGQTWVQARVPVSVDLVSVYFPSPQKGWTVGHRGVVLHTEDGGATWEKQLDGITAAKLMADYYQQHQLRVLPGNDGAKLKGEIDRLTQPGPAGQAFLDVWFENDNTGFIVGSFNLIFRTDDGGKTWEPWFDRTENGEGLHLYAIRPVGKDVFIAGEQGLVLKLDKAAGIFRRKKVDYSGAFFGITGNEKAVVAFGLRGNIFRSINGGSTWTKIESEVTGGLTGGTVMANGTIVLVSQGGRTIASQDSGASFKTITHDVKFPKTAVIDIGNGALAIAGLRGVKIETVSQ